MYCPKCGTQNDDNAFRCTKCGIVLQQSAPKKKSNTAVIVLVVAGAAIGLFIFLAILAAIAIPAFLDYRTKADNAMAQTELTNACHAAAAFFLEHPDKSVTIDDLKKEGLALNPDIELSIENGSEGALSMRARHKKGNKVYVADRDCAIQEIRP
jgi:Tfp pilus assembly protein PilE